MIGNLLDKFNACITIRYTHVENNGSYAIVQDGDTLTLFFEKSNGIVDWWHNFNFPAKPYRKMPDVWFCHRGFLKVWKSIEPYIARDIHNPSIKKIDIIGYSHGGAIAQLCYEYVKYNRPDVEVAGVGFGAPRVLWGYACERVLDRFRGFQVIRNGNDLITHLPPMFLGFRHACKIIKIGQSIGLIRDHFPFQYYKALNINDAPTVQEEKAT